MITRELTILLVDDAEDCLATLEVALQTLPGALVLSARTAELPVFYAPNFAMCVTPWLLIGE